MQTRSQQNSEFVYRQIKTLLDEGNLIEMQRKQYGALCHRFPIMVLRNGLIQTMAYLEAKGNTESAHLSLYMHLRDYLTESGQPVNLQRCDLSKYQDYTRRILGAAIWYKRYAESILNVSAGEDGEQ